MPSELQISILLRANAPAAHLQTSFEATSPGPQHTSRPLRLLIYTAAARLQTSRALASTCLQRTSIPLHLHICTPAAHLHTSTPPRPYACNASPELHTSAPPQLHTCSAIPYLHTSIPHLHASRPTDLHIPKPAARLQTSRPPYFHTSSEIRIRSLLRNSRRIFVLLVKLFVHRFKFNSIQFNSILCASIPSCLQCQYTYSMPLESHASMLPVWKGLTRAS